MKRKFKKGDRVLVRKSDLNKWVQAEFDETDEISRHFVANEDDGFRGVYTQCRHIDDFRTGDKVQGSDDGINWEDATYLVEDPNADTTTHIVENTTPICTAAYAYVRWHPSMPWADKEELTLEQRVEALERKLNER